MYDAAGWDITRGCTECAIDLLQLIASTREIRGEDKVWQFANGCRGLVIFFA